MSKKNIKVPNIGEFKDVEVIEVLIKNGQEIQRNDPLITIESDKSSVEIPSTESGIVSSLKVKIGDKVSEGSDILELEIKEKEIEKKPSNSQPKIINEEKKVEVKKKSNPQNLIVKMILSYLWHQKLLKFQNVKLKTMKNLNKNMHTLILGK